MKRSRDEITSEYSRNVKAKTEAEEKIKSLEEEFDLHPDTLLAKLPNSLHFLVNQGRMTSFATNHTFQNYGYMKVETWLCKFTLDQKVYIGVLGRSFMKSRKYPDWGGISSLNEENKSWFEMVGNGAETATPLGMPELRNEVLSGKKSPDADIWKWALKSEYGNESNAIVLLAHLHYCPTDEKPAEPEPKKKSVPAESPKMPGFEIIALPCGDLESSDE